MDAWWSQHQETAVATFIGIVATVVVAYLVARYQRTFRRLSYAIVVRQRLIPLTGYEDYSDLRIHFQDGQVAEPWIVIIHIVNTGKQDIAPTDITKHISIDIGNNENIRDARVTGSSPEDVYEAARLALDENGRPFLEPVAINRGNSIYVQLLLDGAPNNVTVVGRGVGIDKIERLQAQWSDRGARATPQHRLTTPFFAVLGAVATIALFLSTVAINRYLEASESLLRSLESGRLESSNGKKSDSQIRQEVASVSTNNPPGTGPWPYIVLGTADLGLRVLSKGEADGIQIGSAANRSFLWAECIQETSYTPDSVVDVGPRWLRVKWPNKDSTVVFLPSAPSDRFRGFVYSGYTQPYGHNGKIPKCTR